MSIYFSAGLEGKIVYLSLWAAAGIYNFTYIESKYGRPNPRIFLTYFLLLGLAGQFITALITIGQMLAWRMHTKKIRQLRRARLVMEGMAKYGRPFRIYSRNGKELLHD